MSKHTKPDKVIVNQHGEVTRMSGTIPQEQTGTPKHAEPKK